MQHQLQAVVTEFSRARERLHELAQSTPTERWSVRRDPNKWSVGECIAHLNLTSASYVPKLRAAWAQHPLVAPRPRSYRRDFMGWILSSLSGPLMGIGSFRFGRVKTAPAFVPTSTMTREQCVAEFDALQDAQIALTKDADGRPLNDIRLVSPFDARITYNAYSCLVLLSRHQHRHLWQGEQVWRA